MKVRLVLALLLILAATLTVSRTPARQAVVPTTTEASGAALEPRVARVPNLVATAAPKPSRTPLRAASRHRTQVFPHTASGLNWAALRQCENGGSYTSSPSDHYRGAYQFDYQTWGSVGGTGDPAAASPSEQDYRARLLYKERGRSPWPVCGRHL